MLAFDIGSHKGTFSDYLHNQGYTTIVAVDPLGINESPHNHYIQAVVSDVPGTATLHLNTNTAICSINTNFVEKSRFSDSPHYQPYATFTGTKQVPAITYEQLVAEHGKPHLVKLDVEGHEQQIIKSMLHLPTVIGFEWHEEFTVITVDCLQWLYKMGFHYFELQDFTNDGEYNALPTKTQTYDHIITSLKKTDIEQKPWQLRWGMVWATRAHDAI